MVILINIITFIAVLILIMIFSLAIAFLIGGKKENIYKKYYKSKQTKGGI